MTAVPFTTSCFFLVVAAEPDVIPRVAAVFAKLGLVPSRWYSAADGIPGSSLHIDIQVTGLDPGVRERIAETLRRIVNVEVVLTSEKRLAESA